MYRITFALGGLDRAALAHGALVIMANALRDINVAWLKSGALPKARVPVAHVAEPQGQKRPGEADWQDVATVLVGRRDGKRVAGNVDVAAARAAELTAQGKPASVGISLRPTSRGFFYRAHVVPPGGSAEDPTPGLDGGVIPKSGRYRVTYVLELFEGASDRALSNRALVILLEALTQIDENYLRAHPNTPSIYRSGAMYVEEPSGCEDWQDISTCLAMRRSDCDDLACWRAAELRARGERARPIYSMSPRPDGGTLYHIRTRRQDGRLEDPSEVLGMR